MRIAWSIIQILFNILVIVYIIRFLRKRGKKGYE